MKKHVFFISYNQFSPQHLTKELSGAVTLMCGNTIYVRIEHSIILINNLTLSLVCIQSQPLNWTFTFNNIMYEINMYKQHVLQEL